MEHSGSIVTDRIPEFIKKIEKLNRKAIKLGVPEVKINIGKEKLVTFGEKPKTYEVSYTDIIVEGDDPKLADWSMVAVIIFDETLGTMINVVPGKILDPKYREPNGQCSHCKVTRFRREMVVVENVKTKETKIVGKTCLKDFLGSNSIDSFLWTLSWIQTVGDLFNDDSFCNGSYGTPVYNLERVIGTTIKVVNEHGYVSKTVAKEQMKPSTASNVAYLLDGDRYHNIAPYYPNEEEIKEAKIIIQFISNLDTSSDYNYNLVKIVNAEYTNYRFLGYTVSMVPCYRKAMALIQEKKNQKPSNHVGEIKEKLNISVNFIGDYVVDSYYGTMVINRFKDENGNVFIWNTSTHNDFETDKVYNIRGTVKEHKEFKGQKQTVIKNVKVI